MFSMQLPSSKFANDFHSDNMLHRILKESKLNTLFNQSPVAKHEKIRLMIEDSISEEAKSRIEKVFYQIEQLNLEEKLLLYLKIPILLTNSNSLLDPLKQPLNPLGNRYEIHQTIMWIKTHLEEDPEISLPKQDVYEEYNMFCLKTSMKPLSTADFGKVMKQVYPRVRPRRLGTRGNSRYCYAGMRKKIILNPPLLPSTNITIMDENGEHDDTEELLGAASVLIREWAAALLNKKFPSLCALAKYLVDNFCVNSQSLEAACTLSTSEEFQPVTNKGLSTSISSSGRIGKLREVQLQLQRKLQTKEYVRNQKCQQLNNKQIEHNKEENKREKTSKLSINYTTQGRHLLNNKTACNISLYCNCNNVMVQSTQEEEKYGNNFKIEKNNIPNSTKDFIKQLKNTRKRTCHDIATYVHDQNSNKQLKLIDHRYENLTNLIQKTAKVDVILSDQLQGTATDDTTEESITSLTDKSIKHSDKQFLLNSDDHLESSVETNISVIETMDKLLNDHTWILQEKARHLSNNRLDSIDNDYIKDYLHGGNNSQEHEEELMQYFQQSNSLTSDVDLNNAIFAKEKYVRQDQVSQLRIILQQNLNDSRLSGDKKMSKSETLQNHNLLLPTPIKHNVINPKRRVSFETNIVKHNEANSNSIHVSTTANKTIPQSPNTRRRIFNFTPISPATQSPVNTYVSKSTSTNVSPFVSPRNTPILCSKSNLQECNKLDCSHKLLSRSMSCNVNYVNTFLAPNNNIRVLNSDINTSSAFDSSISLTEQMHSPVKYTPFLSDLTSQESQLLINYPSQENLQEIKNIYQKDQPNDQEISKLLETQNLQYSKEPIFFRSKSVPLHKMVNPALLSPNLVHQNTAISYSFNPSTDSSVTPTPVPSEFNDFGSFEPCKSSDYLLDVDPLISHNQQLETKDAEKIPENLNRVFDIIRKEGSEFTTKSCHSTATSINSNSVIMDSLSNVNLNNSNDLVLDNWTNNLNTSIENIKNSGMQNSRKIVHSRSYPNTPVPLLNSMHSISCSGNSNNSRSYPTTPLHTLNHHGIRKFENNEPMLFSSLISMPTLLNDDNVHNTSCTNIECSVTDLVDHDIPNDDTNAAVSLSSFDFLNDANNLSSLFQEVVETNH